MFEVFDYYWILKNAGISAKIWIPENQNPEYIRYILNKHYSVGFDWGDIILGYNYDIVKVPVVLNVDDCHYFLEKNRRNFLCERFYNFACGDSYFSPRDLPEITTLSDRRIYKVGQHYAKKVLPYLRRSSNRVSEFAHITKNCKSLPKEILSELILKYPNIYIYSDYLMCQNSSKTPIFDFGFEKYIYTPVSRGFDCSPRLLVECSILKIPVEYFCIDYEDPGLEIRRSNPLDYILNENDEIIGILNA